MRTFKVLTDTWPKQYEENTRSWHQAIDFSYIRPGQTVTAQDLEKMHLVEPGYYDDVSELVEDGLIEVIEDSEHGPRLKHG